MAENIQSESDMIQQFINITGTDDETAAKNMLEAFDNNLEMAINMFLEGHNPEQQEIHDEIPPVVYSPPKSSSDTHKRRKTSKHLHKERRRKELEEDEGSVSSISKEHNGLVNIDDDDEDEVRAPIPQKQEVLVEDQYHAIPYQRSRRTPQSVFNVCRDFQKETEEYEKHLKSEKNSHTRKRKRLHELFQPPVDLIHLGDFQSARDVCNSRSKWLLVNIQNSQEFACQVLNRDVWSNQTVRDIINANFIMWQVAHDADEGLHYATFYNVKNYPHISVIDPRTGERMVVWESFGMKPSADQFAELATLFLSSHPNLNESLESNEEETTKNKSVIDLGEEDQLEAAISASLASTSEKEPTESEDDSDVEAEEEVEEAGHQEKLNNVENGNSSGQQLNNANENEINHDSNNSTSTSKNCENVSEKILSQAGEKATILLRLPDNGRKQILFPLECTLKELALELSRLGWPDIRYEVIKAFPRQNISQLDQNLTLKEAGLHKQETLFIQDR